MHVVDWFQILLQVAKVGVHSSHLLGIQAKSRGWVMQECSRQQVDISHVQRLIPLLMGQLQDLPPGQYLLTHVPGEAAVSCFTAQINATQDEPVCIMHKSCCVLTSSISQYALWTRSFLLDVVAVSVRVVTCMLLHALLWRQALIANKTWHDDRLLPALHESLCFVLLISQQTLRFTHHGRILDAHALRDPLLWSPKHLLCFRNVIPTLGI